MSANFIAMHRGSTKLRLDLDSEPKPPTCFHQNDRSRKYIKSKSQLFLLQHSLTHLPKITFQSCIWISTCCYGNRHAALPAGLVWPELVVPFNKKILHILLLFTLKCHWAMSSALAEKSFSGWAVSWGWLPCQTQPKAVDLLETPCLTRIGVKMTADLH